MAKIRPADFQNPHPAFSLDHLPELSGVILRQIAVQHRRRRLPPSTPWWPRWPTRTAR